MDRHDCVSSVEPDQTAHLLLKEQSDQGLHYLPFRLHLFDSLHILWIFKLFLGCPNFSMFTVYFQFWFHLVTDGSGKGAAIAAAVAERRKKDKQNDKGEVQEKNTAEDAEEKGAEEEKKDIQEKETVEKGEKENSKT